MIKEELGLKIQRKFSLYCIEHWKKCRGICDACAVKELIMLLVEELDSYY